jgi:hypothetical protein
VARLSLLLEEGLNLQPIIERWSLSASETARLKDIELVGREVQEIRDVRKPSLSRWKPER